MRVDLVVRDVAESVRQIIRGLDNGLTASENLAPEGTSGHVLTSNGPNSPPSYQAIPSQGSSGGGLIASDRLSGIYDGLVVKFGQLIEKPATLAEHGITDAYTSAEVDALLTNYYTKTEIDTTLADYYTAAQVDALLANKSDVGHTHDAADVVSGTFADARIAQSNVTQHQAALSIGFGQLTGTPTTLAGYGITDAVDGSGTASAIPMWSDSNTLTDSLFTISGSKTIHSGELEIAGGGGISVHGNVPTGDAADRINLGVLLAVPVNENSTYVGWLNTGIVTGAAAGSLALIPRGSAAGSLVMFSGGTTPIARWHLNPSGHLIAVADAAYDIGASGANRPRALYISGAATFGTDVYHRCGTVAFLRVDTGTSQVRLFPNSSLAIRDNLDSATLWEFQNAGHMLAGADNSYDIGASGANRPRNVYIANAFIVGGVPRFDGSTSTSANAGAATALPAQPAGYLHLNIAGTERKVPYYAV